VNKSSTKVSLCYYYFEFSLNSICSPKVLNNINLLVTFLFNLINKLVQLNCRPISKYKGLMYQGKHCHCETESQDM
jgi:hypothetical protein